MDKITLERLEEEALEETDEALEATLEETDEALEETDETLEAMLERTDEALDVLEA
jgi:hypothetical protein